MKTFWSLLKTTYDSWSAHKAPKMGAALAYYTTLSLAPLVVIVAGLVGLVVEHDSARAQIVAQFSDVMGREGGAMVETILSHSAEKKAGLWTALVGFVFLLLGASGAFGELQDSLNEIWEVPPRDFQRGGADSHQVAFLFNGLRTGISRPGFASRLRRDCRDRYLCQNVGARV